MKVVIGLGNPGKTYEHTRHNVGFLVVDELAERYGGEFTNKRSMEAEIAEVEMKGMHTLLVKPHTFMNVSGRVVCAAMSKYPVSIEDMIVVYDDADLPFGDVRLKETGGSAGHRGMESILSALPKGASVARVRIGIGRPPHADMPLDTFVLNRWTQTEEQMLPEIVAQACDVIIQKIDSSSRSS